MTRTFIINTPNDHCIGTWNILLLNVYFLLYVLTDLFDEIPLFPTADDYITPGFVEISLYCVATESLFTATHRWQAITAALLHHFLLTLLFPLRWENMWPSMSLSLISQTDYWLSTV